MKKITLLALCFLTQPTFAATHLPDHRHVSVTGQAEMTAIPDIAEITLALHSKQATSLAAKQDVDRRVNTLLNGLADFNINQKNVSASNLTTQVNYDYRSNQNKKVIGYTARRTIKVTLKQLNKLNDFMDFALKVKVNEIQHIEMKSSKQAQLQDEVNALAVENAKQKGRSLANAFGAALGHIYSINASNNHHFYRYGANQDTELMQASKVAAPMQKGRYLQENIVFNASIDVVFDLKTK